jgi:hypothetical protein
MWIECLHLEIMATDHNDLHVIPPVVEKVKTNLSSGPAWSVNLLEQ